MPHWLSITFLFLLGACVGSFLNVVVYRLPRVAVPAGTSLLGELWLTLRGLSSPPSHCPKCDTPLSWRDNVPIVGWMFLGGRCRYCKAPIAKRYPSVELATALLFAGTYALMFLFDLGPCAPTVTTINRYGVEEFLPGGLFPARDGWLLAIYLPLIACLIAASLIDFELLIIPLWIPWLMALVGLAGHAWGDRPGLPGALVQSPAVTLMALGGGVGLVASLALLRLGVLRQSFADGEPMTKNEQDALAAGATIANEADVPLKSYAPREVRREMRHEVLFLLPPIALAFVLGYLALTSPPFATLAQRLADAPHVGGLLGALLGALVGAAWVWGTRILGSLVFGREAMGMGDVHLMFGVGAMLGAGMTSVAFFLAPFPGLIIHLYLLFTDPKRAVPYGPYLSFGSLLVIFIYCPISDWLGGGVAGLGIVLRQVIGV